MLDHIEHHQQNFLFVYIPNQKSAGIQSHFVTHLCEKIQLEDGQMMAKYPLKHKDSNTIPIRIGIPTGNVCLRTNRIENQQSTVFVDSFSKGNVISIDYRQIFWI